MPAVPLQPTQQPTRHSWRQAPHKVQHGAAGRPAPAQLGVLLVACNTNNNPNVELLWGCLQLWLLPAKTKPSLVPQPTSASELRGGRG